MIPGNYQKVKDQIEKTGIFCHNNQKIKIEAGWAGYIITDMLNPDSPIVEETYGEAYMSFDKAKVEAEKRFGFIYPE